MSFSVSTKVARRNQKRAGKLRQRIFEHGFEAVGRKSSVSVKITPSDQNPTVFPRFRLCERHVKKG